MARLHKPMEAHKLAGADKAHPERYRKEVPKSKLPLGEAPEYMAEDAKACWFEISSLTIPGVMTGADRFMLEIASSLLAEFRRDPVEFAGGKYTHLISCLARFGMSPSDRTKLGVDATKPDNEFDNLDD